MRLPGSSYRINSVLGMQSCSIWSWLIFTLGRSAVDNEFWNIQRTSDRSLKVLPLQSISKRWKPYMLSKLFGDDHDVPSWWTFAIASRTPSPSSRLLHSVAPFVAKYDEHEAPPTAKRDNTCLSAALQHIGWWCCWCILTGEFSGTNDFIRLGVL
jgi:hypothetical protein